ncbi:MAG: response regulator [Caldilineaceae bacterium]|nr:response regulator [Caldilineaceae bacterium]MBP8122323.1 response regulator [Caldilineaceae bacterium]MBP9072681.1 response regulator [Caldilineaceae bacterium]
MSAKLQIGEKYQIRVIRQLRIGLLVELADGRRGIVREREIAWSQEESLTWRERYQPGEEHQAVLLKDDGDALELSLRLAIRDPWINAAESHRPGAWVQGIVTGLDESGTFVELEPGVMARLHQNQLPDWNRQELQDLFWPDDTVRAEVIGVDIPAREITLSMKNLLARRWPTDRTDTFRAQPLPKQSKEEDEQVETRLPLEILASQGMRSILIIEDDPRQNQAITDQLRRAGHRVQGVLDAEQGLSLLAREAFDIVLSDAGLPGMDGVEVLRRVRQDYPQTCAFLMTDWSKADRRNGEIAALEEQGIRLLLKPLTPLDLFRIFETDNAPVFYSAERTLATAQPLPAFVDQQISVQQRLHQVLDEFRSLTQATQAVLFVRYPDQGQIEVADSCGRGHFNQSAVIHLLHSPVRDAIEDRLLVRVRDSQQVAKYVRYLLPLLSFRSCLGAPISGNLASQYALFLFFAQTNGFDEGAEQMAQAGALALGALLEQQIILERMAEMQRTLLVGHLTSALVHEANHQLSPIVFALEELQDQCGRVERSIGGPVADALQEMQETRTALDSLSMGLQNLMRTTKMFGRITVQDEVRMVRIDKVLGRCMELLKDMADRAHVVLEYEPPTQILVTKAKETLVQQILLNLLLNAVQQIALTRPATGGRVHAFIRKQTTGQRVAIQIGIEDDGPGIHRSQWQRIFDLGMTTRKSEGSGLGLYLVERLCEEIHGHVSVEESAILWGTRFVVEIPVNL